MNEKEFEESMARGRQEENDCARYFYVESLKKYEEAHACELVNVGGGWYEYTYKHPKEHRESAIADYEKWRRLTADAIV